MRPHIYCTIFPSFDLTNFFLITEMIPNNCFFFQSTEDLTMTANVMEKFIFSEPVTNATSETNEETKVADFFENVKILNTALDEMVHEDKIANMEKDYNFVME